jgi:hypothetical protein
MSRMLARVYPSATKTVGAAARILFFVSSAERLFM